MTKSERQATLFQELQPGPSQDFVEWYRWTPDYLLEPPGPPVDFNLSLPEESLSLSDLQTRSVAVFGLGAVGGEILSSLAKLGVDRLIAVDPDNYEEGSWQTQPALPRDSGHPKAWVQGRRAHATNPGVDVRAGIGRAQAIPLSLLRDVDLFVSAGDNLDLLVWAGNLAAALGKPLVQGAVHGPSWTAIVRSFNPAPATAPCPGCLLGSKEWQRLTVRYGCDPASAEAGRPAEIAQPTRTLPQLCTTAAQLAVVESVKKLLALDEHSLQSEEVSYCLLTHQLFRSELPRNPRCRCPHEQWETRDVDEPLSGVSLSGLASRAGCKKGECQVRGEAHWFSESPCQACGTSTPVRRFARGFGVGLGACRCGGSLIASPVGARSILPSKDVEACWEVPLPELGLQAGEAVGLAGSEGWTYFFLPGELAQPTAAEKRTGHLQGQQQHG